VSIIKKIIILVLILIFLNIINTFGNNDQSLKYYDFKSFGSELKLKNYIYFSFDIMISSQLYFLLPIFLSADSSLGGSDGFFNTQNNNDNMPLFIYVNIVMLLLFFVISCVSSYISGKICFKSLVSAKTLLILGLFNISSIIGVIIKAFSYITIDNKTNFKTNFITIFICSFVLTILLLSFMPISLITLNIIFLTFIYLFIMIIPFHKLYNYNNHVGRYIITFTITFTIITKSLFYFLTKSKLGIYAIKTIFFKFSI